MKLAFTIIAVLVTLQVQAQDFNIFPDEEETVYTPEIDRSIDERLSVDYWTASGNTKRAYDDLMNDDEYIMGKQGCGKGTPCWCAKHYDPELCVPIDTYSIILAGSGMCYAYFKLKNK